MHLEQIVRVERTGLMGWVVRLLDRALRGWRTRRASRRARGRWGTQKVAYVAGPFRGKDVWEIEQNIRRAEEIALRLWRTGYAVICPHANTRFFQGAADDGVWLRGDLELLRRCDLVVLTPDWRRSAGACAEVEEAVRLGIPVYEGIG